MSIEHERLCEIDTPTIINKFAMAKPRECQRFAAFVQQFRAFDTYAETTLSGHSNVQIC